MGGKFFNHSTHSQPGLSAFIYQPLVPIIDVEGREKLERTKLSIGRSFMCPCT